MNPKRVVGAIVGIVLAMLGLLRFLQGTGVVRMCPLFCFVDCECVEGGSLFWGIAGALTFAIGVVLVWVSVLRGNS
jgi:hypothetical protein